MDCKRCLIVLVLNQSIGSKFLFPCQVVWDVLSLLDTILWKWSMLYHVNIWMGKQKCKELENNITNKINENPYLLGVLNDLS